MPAFDLGIASGADGIELDVRLSRDGIVMVHHDRTLTRTTAGSGAVADRSASELQRLGVPTLADVLGRHPNTRVIVEMKLNTGAFAQSVVDVVRAAGAVERVCVGAFGLRGMRALRRIEPRLATSAAREEVRWALYRSWCRWPRRRAPYAGYQVPEGAGATRIVSPRFVSDAHSAGLAVHVWTVNLEADARRLLSWGVDGLITDRPDLVAPLVASL